MGRVGCEVGEGPSPAHSPPFPPDSLPLSPTHPIAIPPTSSPTPSQMALPHPTCCVQPCLFAARSMMLAAALCDVAQARVPIRATRARTAQHEEMIAMATAPMELDTPGNRKGAMEVEHAEALCECEESCGG